MLFFLLSIPCGLVPALAGCDATGASAPAVRTQLATGEGEPPGERAAKQPGEIRVLVRNFRNKDGQALISLFESSKGFPDRGDLARDRAESTIDEEVVDIVFPNIPPGTYAVAALHDEDGDYEMDTGLFGIPKEGYGVSRNARRRFGPPKFEDAKFTLPPGVRVTVDIELYYH